MTSSALKFFTVILHLKYSFLSEILMLRRKIINNEGTNKERIIQGLRQCLK